MNIDKYTLITLKFFLVLTLVFTQSNLYASTLDILVGSSETLKFDSIIKEVNVDDLSVVDVVKGKDKTQIQLLGKSKGRVKVLVSFYDQATKEYVVSVSTNLDALQKNISKDFPYLDVRVSGSKVEVNGKFKNETDKKIFRSKYLSKDSNFSIVDNVTNTPSQILTICKNINNLFLENMITNAKATNYGHKIVIEGSFISASQTDKVKRIAQKIYPNIEMKLDKSIDASDSLNVEVLFIEVERRKNLDVGNKAYLNGYHNDPGSFLASAQSVSEPKTTKFLGSTLQWQVGPLYAFLEMIEKTVVSKIFSHPKLVVRSGKAAQFHAGSTVMFPKTVVVNGVTTKEYEQIPTGIEIQIVPKSDNISRIDNDIHIKVSDLRSTGEIPDISVSEIQTAVTVDNSQSILLSGLSLKEDKKSVDKVPLLGSIPVLGEFFKYRSKTGKTRQILVILTVTKINSYVKPSQIIDSLVDQADKDISFSVFD